MAGKSLLITPSPEPSHTTTSTRLLRSLKGVRHWWTPRHNHQTTHPQKGLLQQQQQQTTYSEKDGIAMTLTAAIGIKEDMQTATTLHSANLQFTPNAAFDTTHNTVTIPSCPSSSSPSPTYNARAFVHYDPTKSCLALGADPESNPTQTIWLSLERYTWLIYQLHEEQNVCSFLKNCCSAPSNQQQHTTSANTHRQSAPPPPSTRSGFSSPCLGWYPFLCTPSPILGVLDSRCTSSTTTPLARRLSRFVHRGSHKPHHYHHLPPLNDIYLFMIPKALLLQAAAYIPMTKPLPPMHQQQHSSSFKLETQRSPPPDTTTKRKPSMPSPFTDLTTEDTQRLERYVYLVALTAHDLMATPTPSPTTTTTTTTTATTQVTAVDDQKDSVDSQKKPLSSKIVKFELVCGRCGLDTCLDTVTSATLALSAAAAMETSSKPPSNAPSNGKDDRDEDKGNVVESIGSNDTDDQHQQHQRSLTPSISVSKPGTFLHHANKRMLIDSAFTITYFQPILNTSSESTHLYQSARPYSHSPLPVNIPTVVKQHQQPSSFNTFPKRQHHGSIDHLSCSESGSTSGATTGSLKPTDDPLTTTAGTFERRGYIAIDHTHKEIHVVFPGLPLARNNTNQLDLDPSFFTAVPWLEEGHDGIDEMDGIPSASSPPPSSPPLASYDQQQRKRKPSRRRTLLRRKNTEVAHQQPQQPQSPLPAPSTSSPSTTSPPSSSSLTVADGMPWVLNGALIAWRRCELSVATLLMRACKSTPDDYRVIMVGNGLGSAVAALCALSLVSTGLLSHRSVTYCGIHPPRIGDHTFGQLFSNQHIETIRIMDPNDIMAHLPPRTSGLVHLGTTTVINPKRSRMQGHSAHSMEDIIDRALPTTAKTFALDCHGSALDIDLYPLSCPSIDMLTLP